MAIHQPREDLVLVDLDLPREGVRRFIAPWVLRRGTAVLLVDPGPRATVPVLLDALQELGVARLDGILLTHIHIDHAGGAGLLLERFPGAAVVCHPKGIPHLADPTRLWEGSRKVLGDLAEAYGEIAAVPQESLIFGEALELGAWRVSALETPGHAAHHASYVVGDVVFGGEVAGMRYELPSGVYQRPATPPVFYPDVYRASIDRVAGVGAAHLCLGHYGLAERPAEVLEVAREQIEIWTAVAARCCGVEEGADEAILHELLETDRHFARLRELPPDIQVRERYFARNSIAGIRGAVAGERS
ncbi:MAG: MBL fold metallo-hydrolase [Deltaproteobacteria bacterium]|nr:MBL fold metallo-hydrolase [Deltaproteobacteria bacterium]